MSYIKIWVHTIWATKNREPVLVKKIRKPLFKHIRENGLKKNIYIDFINGYKEHVHCLFSLNSEESIAKSIQLIKGESSFWINKEKILPDKFEWQDEYFAVSVCESKLNMVREYIKNQEQHHQNVSFQDEYGNFIKKYGFNYKDPGAIMATPAVRRQTI
ncbi:MAG: IS200/IS605 family transposase [Chitinophagaceae bacterium]|nr:IS200/IS605 family transposase [Chitinophagaceae bacterium]